MANPLYGVSGVGSDGFVKYKPGTNTSYGTSKANEWLATNLARNYGATQAAQLNSNANYLNPVGMGRPGFQMPGGSGTGGSGGKASATSGGGSGLLGYLQSLYSNYANNKQAQIEAAYNRAAEGLRQGYSEAEGALRGNYDAAANAINESYKNSAKNVETDATRSLREAFVNNEINKKNLGQQMSALGLSGGATESTLAKFNNSYGNASNDIRTTRNTNLGNLNATKSQSLADALAQYNSNLASLKTQLAGQLASLEQARANGLIDALDKEFSFQTSSGYLNALQDAMKNMNGYQLNPTQANNTIQNVNFQQLTPEQMAQTTNYEEFLKYLGLA